MKKIKSWLAKKNEPFSLITGENFTNSDIFLTFVGVVTFVAICLIMNLLNF